MSFSFGYDISGGAGAIPDEVTLTFPVLLSLSSAMNPLIYAIYSTKFRNRMKDILQLRFIDKSGLGDSN